MKKFFAALFAFILLLTGCAGRPGWMLDSASSSFAADSSAPGGESALSSESLSSGESDPAAEGDLPGCSYTLPEGWVNAEEYSTSEKIFYIQKGHENDQTPDNISINLGTNRYSAQDHTVFRDAIVQQLLMQLKGSSAELKGDGSHTSQGYVIYTFTIEESDVITRQYYIVDDYHYCLVHLTNFTGSEEADQAAESIADSFVWTDKAE